MSDMPLREKMDDPKTMESLASLMSRASTVETLVDRAAEATGFAENVFATATDVVDEQCEKINATGTSVDSRAASLLDVLLKLTEPETIESLKRLIDRLPQLEQATRLLDEAPNLIATLTDVFDEWAGEMKADGIDLEKSLRQGIRSALWFGQSIGQMELDRLGVLLRSDMLDEHAVECVAKAGTALARCHEGQCDVDSPKQVGPIGAFRALFNPNTQKALSFAIRFSQCFGSSLDDDCSTSQTVSGQR